MLIFILTEVTLINMSPTVVSVEFLRRKVAADKHDQLTYDEVCRWVRVLFTKSRLEATDSSPPDEAAFQAGIIM